jgi:hypothetical protein
LCCWAALDHKMFYLAVCVCERWSMCSMGSMSGGFVMVVGRDLFEVMTCLHASRVCMYKFDISLHCTGMLQTMRIHTTQAYTYMYTSTYIHVHKHIHTCTPPRQAIRIGPCTRDGVLALEFRAIFTGNCHCSVLALSCHVDHLHVHVCICECPVSESVWL